MFDVLLRAFTVILHFYLAGHDLVDNYTYDGINGVK